MFKKTRVRSILELLGKDLSGREVSKVLGVSRNTVAEVQSLFEASGKSWEEYSNKCIAEGVKPCSYITYTKNYNKYTADKNYTSHIERMKDLVAEPRLIQS